MTNNPTVNPAEITVVLDQQDDLVTTPMERFQDLASKLFQVSKDEVTQQEGT